MSVGIFVTNEEGRVSLWNSAMERETGLLGEITLGNFIWDVYFGLLSPDVKQINTLERLREKFLALLTPSTSNTRGFKMNFDFIQQNGTRFKAQGIVFAVPTAKGYCLFNVLSNEAIRFHIEDTLKISEEKFRYVVEQARDGIVVLDAREEILEWNDGCEQISGIDRERALGMRLSDVMPELFQGPELALLAPDETLHHQTLQYLELDRSYRIAPRS